MVDVRDNSEILHGSDPDEAVPVPPDTEVVPFPPNIRPNGDLVLIRRLAVDETTPGGLVIPKGMKKRFFRAELLRMGRGQPLDNGEWFRSADCKEGDIVLVKEDPPENDPRFAHVSRNLIPVSPLGDTNFLLCPGSNIYAVELKEATDTTS